MKNKVSSDIIGILSASLCTVHCLFMPFLILLTSSFSWWHEVSYFFLVISFFAAYEASNRTDSKTALRIIWASFTLLAVCILFEDEFHILHELSYLASIGLIIGHIYNLRHCKNCHHE
jgi:hypothetical protein